MKSKISFFNGVVFWKNMKLYWPIWLVYFAFLAAWMPCRIALEFWQAKDYMILYGSDANQQYIRTINNALDTKNHILAIAVVTIAAAMAMFHYLTASRSANMFHAYPVNRTELYGTGVLGGLAFIWIPQIVVFITSLLLCIAYGATSVEYLALWLVMMMGLSFFEYALAVVSMMCTGQMLGAPFVFAAFNVVYYIFRFSIAEAIGFFAYGMNNVSSWENGHLNWLSPIVYMLNKVSFDYNYDSKLEAVTGLSYVGTEVAAGYFVAGIIVFVIGLLLYKRRNIECAGDLAAFPSFKPVFRWGAGMVSGLLLCVFLYSLMQRVDRHFYDSYFFICALFLGSITFFLMDMLIQKSFRVFNKKRFKEYAIYLSAFFIVIGAIDLGGEYYENMVPDRDEIDSIFVQYDYAMEVPLEKYDELVAIQKEIIEKEREYGSVKSTYGSDVSFVYNLVNGEKIERFYNIPITDKTIKNIFVPLYEIENDKDIFFNFLVGHNSDKIFETGISGSFSMISPEGASFETELTGPQVETVLNAAIKEAVDGNLRKTYLKDPSLISLKKYDDGTYIVQEESHNGYSYYVTLSFECNDLTPYSDSYLNMHDPDWLETYEKDRDTYTYYGVVTEYYLNTINKNIWFDDNCGYILQGLVEAGVAENPDAIHNLIKGEK